MKKVFIFFVTLIILVICFIYIRMTSIKSYLIETDNIATIDELYIYGNHLNLKGNIDIDKDVKLDNLNLILYSKEEITIPLSFDIVDRHVNFKLSDKLNNGLYLDDINIGNYNLYIEIISGEEKLYYKLDNNTNYTETKYYSISKNNKCNEFIFNNKNETINLKITESKNDLVYDIVIDPGHGGVDKGACANGYCETDFTYLISLKIKTKLEEKGLKVKLTRDDLDSTERLANYGEFGRVNVANASKAKYLLAIHLNSNSYGDKGVEVYTAYDVDYTFAQNLSKSIVDKALTNYSTNNAFKVSDGVYTRTLQDIDLKETYQNAISHGYTPYDVSNETTYYFIIRETGGYMAGAYKDDRDGTAYNYSVNSNVGIESYLIELAYLTNSKDVKNINDNIDNYVDAIVNALINEIQNEK